MKSQTAGNQTTTDFFANATKNRVAMVPGAAYLVNFANKGGLGAGAATAMNSRVRGAQMNGSGPAILPVTAPFSFTQFATGLRTLAMKRVGKR